MRYEKPVRVASLLAASLAAALLAGCGGSPSDAVALESVAQAATRTAEARTSRFEQRTRMDVGGRIVEVHSRGTYDYERQRARMTVSMPPAGEVETIVDGTVFYMRLPAALAGTAQAGGKKWLRLDLEAAGDPELAAAVQAQQQRTPAQILDFLEAAAGTIEQVGTEEVRGVATTRYRAALDARKAAEAQLEAVPEEQREQVRKTVEASLAQLGSTSMPVDLWVDAEGRLRRLETAATVPAGAKGAATSLSMSMELFDFGVAVDAEPPPAAEVVDISRGTGGAPDN